MIHLLDIYPFNMAMAALGNADKALSIYIPGVEKALGMLSKREREVLLCRYRDGKTLEACGRESGVSRQRISQIQERTLRKLRRPKYAQVFCAAPQEDVLAQQAEIKRLKSEQGALRKAYEAELSKLAGGAAAPTVDIEKIRNISILDLDLSTRSFNCLARSRIFKLGQIATCQ